MEPKQAKALKNNPVPNAALEIVLRGFFGIPGDE